MSGGWLFVERWEIAAADGVPDEAMAAPEPEEDAGRGPERGSFARGAPGLPAASVVAPAHAEVPFDGFIEESHGDLSPFDPTASTVVLVDPPVLPVDGPFVLKVGGIFLLGRVVVVVG